MKGLKEGQEQTAHDKFHCYVNRLLTCNTCHAEFKVERFGEGEEGFVWVEVGPGYEFLKIKNPQDRQIFHAVRCFWCDPPVIFDCLTARGNSLCDVF